jgi:hypothetical protein
VRAGQETVVVVPAGPGEVEQRHVRAQGVEESVGIVVAVVGVDDRELQGDHVIGQVRHRDLREVRR